MNSSFLVIFACLVYVAGGNVFRPHEDHIHHEDQVDHSEREIGLHDFIHSEHLNPIATVDLLASVQKMPNVIILCTGAFISHQHILTTARCLYGESPSDLFINALSTTPINGVVADVDRIIIHPHYTENPEKSDIGIIHLKTSIPKSFVFTLPNVMIDDDHVMSYTFGWTFDHDKKQFHQYVEQGYIIKRSLCSATLGIYIDCRTLCSGESTVAKTKFDEGTPLALVTPNATKQADFSFEIAGIFSMYDRRISNGTEQFLTIYPFVSWITSHIK